MYTYRDGRYRPQRRSLSKLLKVSAGVSTAVLAAALTLGAPTQDARADNEIPFDVAEIFFELNNTDGDLGIHGKIDGGPWTHIAIEDPNGRKMMNIRTRGRLNRQAVTEISFESAEPTFDELDPEDFFDRFPEGTYEVEGWSQDGEELESETEVTHTMPAPAEPTVNGEPLAEVCDEDDPDFDAPEVNAPVTISWPAVTISHPDLGTDPQVPVTIVNYEVVVEVEVDDFASVFSVVLPPEETSMTIPEEFLAQGDTFKYEVLAREESFNQTAVESCFLLEE